jgi:hypothetical protein
MKEIYKATGVVHSKVTHHRTAALQYAGFNGLAPYQINTLTNHLLDKQHSAYQSQAEWEVRTTYLLCFIFGCNKCELTLLFRPATSCRVTGKVRKLILSRVRRFSYSTPESGTVQGYCLICINGDRKQAAGRETKLRAAQNSSIISSRGLWKCSSRMEST